MSPHRLLNLALAALIAVMLSAAYLLDGPSDIQAIQANADSTQDAIKSAATHTQRTGARARKDHKTIVAQVAP